MKKQQLEALLYQMTQEEKNSIQGMKPAKGTLGELDAAYLKEGDVYVFMESDLSKAPVSIPGYEKSSRHFNFLNIVASKHVRFAEVPLHRHEFVELNYVLSGEIHMVINGHDIEISQGDLCIMDSNVTHSIGSTQEQDMMLNILLPKTYFNMTFLTTFMGMDLVSRFFAGVLSEKNRHDQYLLIHCQDSESIQDMIENIFCEFLEPKIGSSNVIHNYLSLILIESVRSYQSAMGEKATKKSGYLTDILQYIDEHCESCTLKEVADLFNYSPSHLSKKLKKRMGKSFQELVSDQRLQRVALQLESSSKPISQIAGGCGYQNLAFFYKKFQQKFDCTPKEYREFRSQYGLR